VAKFSTVKGVLVDSIEGGLPGTFKYYSYKDNEHAGILFGCPCGCGSILSIAFVAATPGRATWTWDGEIKMPTVSPSILNWNLNAQGEKVSEHWHGYLTGGVFMGL
jgi:hypothetical protein